MVKVKFSMKNDSQAEPSVSFLAPGSLQNKKSLKNVKMHSNSLRLFFWCSVPIIF